MAKIDTSELKAFQAKLKQVATPAERQRFYEACLGELTARFLRKVIKRTPVGKTTYEPIREKDGSPVTYRRGKRKGEVKLRRLSGGGTLRRGWSMLLKGKIRVQRIGDTYQVELVNNTEYASYVEYGHRQTPGRYVPAIGKRLKAAWVEGQFPMTLSAREVESAAPAILARKIQRYFEERIHGK
ncbi:HK97 gp10 family phage protein [Selenomonas flueggei]|uniref:HK97 gp10 family phage protein n=1 Tax=Selenomonas flueggei TaxID=135080 RepID=UPI002672D793|nr:HK97 gp10 family phage protein [Selenomonas flueggei]